MADNQTEVSACDEGVFIGVYATDVHSPSIKRNCHERDDRDIKVGILNACYEERLADEDTLLVKAKLKGRNLLMSALTAALILLLLCRLLCSILAATLSLLRQNKGQQLNDALSNQVTTFHGINIDVEHDSGTGLGDDPNSKLAEANTESSLQEAFRAEQDAFDQFLNSQRDVDLDRCIESWRDVLAFCPVGHETRSSILKNLGRSLQIRFDRNGGISDLDECIRHQQEFLSVCPIGHPGRALMLKNLANLLDTRCDRTGKTTDPEENIRYHQEALTQCSIGHPDQASTVQNPGVGLNTTRFEQTGNMADLEEGIRYHQKVPTPISHPDRASTLNNLGNGLRTQFRKTRNIADLEEGIRHHREALALHPIDHPDRTLTLNNLGNGLSTRFAQTGNMDDLSESIHHHLEALALRPIGHPGRASTLSNLGNGLSNRFGRTGNMSDLEESIRHHQEALVLRPIGHPGRASTLNNLGIGLDTRFGQTGNMADLEESIHHHQEALALRPIGDPGRASTLSNLGNGLSNRFGWTGNTADLKESIRHHQEALTLRPIGHPDRASTLNNLGKGLGTRFEQTGNMTDLEESMCHHQEALTLRPIGHPDRPSTLNNLGLGLNTRFERIGNIADLEESIHYHQEALKLHPIGHPDRPSTLNNLGLGLNARFERTGHIADLEESIRYQQEALTLHPIGHPDRASTLNNLGLGLNARFEQMGNMVDLEESICYHQEALTLHPIGHRDRASTLSNFGNVLDIRFRQTGDIGDLEESIRHHQEALSLLPLSHPDRASAHNNLGNVLGARAELTGLIADLQESIEHYTTAAGQTLSALSVRLTGASNWIMAAHKNRLESLGDAYSTYMDLLDHSLLLSASSIHNTYAHIMNIRRHGGNVTEDATSYSIEKHRLSEAVEIAERGRALLFSQLGNYRTSLDDLEAVNKGLADRFRALSTALDHSATSLPDTMGALPASGDQVARRQRMAADWDRTVKEIRRLDGFRDFLDVTPFANLQIAAAGGPVILINISRGGSHALIITATGEPLSVPLPNATPRAVIALANTLLECSGDNSDGPESNQRLMEMLRDLWVIIVAPIVLQLETTLCFRLGSRIWWMPTSYAWWLPLHAAGPYKPGERNLPDRFISSYTTTLSSLIRARASYTPTTQASGPRMLVIAQAEPEGYTTLPNVEAEVALIRQLGTGVTIIEGEDCTRDAVLAGLKDMAWVHFSCHGHQHLTEPFKSHFSLRTADAPLTLLDIIQNDLPRAELAVLLTCHSAAVGSSMPNESINLVAGIVFAGFRSAVGTMWAMSDEDGPVMTGRFYKHMFRNGPEAVDCRDAAKATAMGVMELRRRNVPLVRWINFVHFGI
ncbi:hypothetical protein FRB94_006905 [Tulasnella sp. JGI-2019a]|nr:hypothetical protein FRB94_006905 [Tulasnella sp. JGI-2019a]